MPAQQWEMTLDVIKSKAQSLSVENDNLQTTYRQLSEEIRELQQAVDRQKTHNAQMEEFLKARHGRSDQQERMDELAALIKAKALKAKLYDVQLDSLQMKKAKLDENINHLKYTISGMEFRPSAFKAAAEQKLSDEDLGAGRLYDLLRSRKEELEAKISAYELRMDQLRQSSLGALPWAVRKKRMVHEMARMDAQNARVRDAIKMLREDIGVLKDKISKLEKDLH